MQSPTSLGGDQALDASPKALKQVAAKSLPSVLKARGINGLDIGPLKASEAFAVFNRNATCPQNHTEENLDAVKGRRNSTLQRFKWCFNQLTQQEIGVSRASVGSPAPAVPPDDVKLEEKDTLRIRRSILKHRDCTRLRTSLVPR